MNGALAPSLSERAVVQLDGGPVSLESVDQLVARRDSLSSLVSDLDTRSTNLQEEAAGRFRDGAAYLVAQRSMWDAAGAADLLSQIDRLTAQVDDVDRQLADVKAVSRRGLRGFFKSLGDRQRTAHLRKQRNLLAGQVSVALTAIGMQAPLTTTPEADALLGPARQQAAEAATLRERSQVAAAAIVSIKEEIDRRQEAINKLGFDSLWLAAWLQNHEPAAVESPVALHRGEVAWLASEAVLSRQATRTRWTGSSQGVSFPIGHTGIRYRVGAFRGHPVQTMVIQDLDSGSLVLTNQRLVFVGHLKSVAIALQQIVHVEAYTDGLGVFRDTRESPDFFKVHSPQYVLFFINYALSRMR